MENKEGRWLFIVKTDDRPGAAASVAVVFSGRGLQIESFIGYGDVNYHSKNTEGVIAITFKAFERQVQHVSRVLTRLEQVRELDAYHYEDPQLTKTATVRINRPVRKLQSLLTDYHATVVDLNHEDNGTYGAVVSGSPPDVDAAIEVAIHQGILISSIYAILPPK